MGRTPRKRAVQVGFTLLELVVVVAIAGTVMVLAVPGYFNHTSNQRTLSAARTLAADLHVAQQEAVTRRAAVIVTFLGADAACSAGQPTASYVISGTSAVIKRTCLPPDVEWAPVPSSGLTFQSLGMPEASFAVALHSRRTGLQHTVTVKAQTGNIADDTR